MKSDKDDEQSASQKAATGTTTEHDSGEGTSAATAPTSADPATEPASTSRRSPTFSATRSDDLSTDHSLPRGISMVQTGLIVFDPPLSTTDTTEDIVQPATTVAMNRATNEGSYDNVREDSDGLASVYTLDKDVQQYIKNRESGICSYSDYPGTESESYDYISERNDNYTTNLLESTAYLIKGSLGAAVLSMHEAYMIGGLWTSLCVTIFVGVLLGYTMIMLIRSARKMYRRLRITKLSYPDLAEAALATAPWHCVSKRSKAFRYIVEVSLLLQMCGTCCIYQIVIANCMKQIVESLNADIYKWLYDIRIYILLCTPLLIPLCLIKSLKLMAPFAMAADIFVVICILMTLYYSLLSYEMVNVTERAAWKSAHGFFRVFGICMYGTSGVCFALPVENNMRSPRYFPLVVRYATTAVIISSIMTGFFGYWAWGEGCKSPITVHMPINIFTTILQFFLVLMLSTTFAVNFWVPFRVVWHYIIRKHRRRHGFWELFYRFFMALLVMGLSLIIPNTIPVMIFLGHFFLGFVALVFPAVIEFIVDWEEEYTIRNRTRLCRNTKNFFLVILGLTLSGLTVYSVRDIR